MSMEEEKVENTAVDTPLGYTQSKIINFDYTWVIQNYDIAVSYQSPIFSPGCDGKLKFYLTVPSVLKANKNARTRPCCLCLLPCNIPDLTVKYDGFVNVNLGKLCSATATYKCPSTPGITEFESVYGDPTILKYSQGKDVSILLKIELVVNKYNIPASTAVIEVPKAQLLEDLEYMFENQKFSDVIINVCGQELPAHKMILSMRSCVFAAMFQYEMAEKQENRVTIDDLEPEVVKELLRYMYTDKVPTLKKMADKLLVAAGKYGLGRLMLMCEETLRANLTIDNAVNTLILADFHNAQQLKAMTIDFITLHTMEIMETESFKSMKTSHPSLIMEILRALGMRTSSGADEQMLHIL